MSILQLNQVGYAYKNKKTQKRVLRDINISFDRGRMQCIVGKSGSGKTTLISLIAGLDVCDEGEILCDGKSLREIDRDFYRSNTIGVIFQSYNLLLNTSALDNVKISLNISNLNNKAKHITAKEVNQKALHCLEMVGIDKEMAKRKVLKLSGGEQQRVAIARALSHNPSIIIADEPTGNLDKENEKIIMEIMKTLAYSQNKCVILVTHSETVSAYADTVYRLGEQAEILPS